MNSWNLLVIAGAALGHLGAPPAGPIQGSTQDSFQDSFQDRPSEAISGTILDAGSGVPVEGAQVILVQSRRGTRTSAQGAFEVMIRPGAEWTGEIEVRHPCFHTVRIEVGRDTLTDPLVVGLPFRLPRGPDGTVTPILCGAYGPAGP